MGGLFSVHEGIHKISLHEGLNNPMIAIAVLAVSMILEASSLYGCITQINKVRGDASLWKWFRNSRQSELIVVLGEDTAALLGLSFALIAVIMTIITGNPVYDSIGSISIGALLIVISMFLAVKIKNLLIGQSTDEETRTEIITLLEARPEVEQILNLITLQLGPQIMVAVKAKMANTDNLNQLVDNINSCEHELRESNPDIKWVFFEPDIR